ncbi:putative F-box protein At3g20705 [Solanum lycopersicum]|uniref:F-box domain-containing protein n=1 Tax=Solanum lycopersicum TaxID=4081 RepID=A0A3Q7ID05_SOLLC|nr:F-box protein CPR1-like [Solanum lycopersicum]
MDGCMANSPEDIVKEILLRCPVKSLLRFKCVCKNWCALIKTPEFAQGHLKNRSPPQLLIYDNGDIDDDDDLSITLISEEHPRRFIGMKQLFGSVDGLFFMVGEIDREVSCSLWNPATRELRPIRLPIPVATIHDAPVFGFGLDTLTYDYKVVYFHINNLCEHYASVYSCSRNFWRIFKPNIPYFTDVKHTFGTSYLNGGYYWLLTGERPCNYTIILFDFGSEMFTEIEGPGHQLVDTNMLGLMSVDSSIAILNLNPSTIFAYDIWVMIQPGVWNKLVTFQCFFRLKSCYHNSLIFATKDSQLVSFDVRTNKTRHLGFQHAALRKDAECDGDCGVFCYKESLVKIERRDYKDLDH